MKRLKGWDKALREALMRHRDTPFAWGSSDCFLVAMDCVLAMTGEDPANDVRDYTNATEAVTRLQNRGFANVGEAIASLFPEMPPAMARRGDVGIVEIDGRMSGCVFIGAQIVGKAVHGLAYLPRSQAKRAFKVGE
jgi:hypothetical protein